MEMYARSVLSAIAVAAFIAAPAAGCSSGGAKTAGPAGPPKSQGQHSQPPPAVTASQARQILDSYSRINNEALTHLDLKLDRTIDSDTIFATDRAFVKIQRRLHQRPQPFTYLDPEFIIPRLPGYPKWFGVKTHAKKSNYFIMIFAQSAPGSPWKHSSSAPLPNNVKVPPIARDAESYATAVSAQDFRLSMTPAMLPARYAKFLGGSPAATEGIVADKQSSEVAKTASARHRPPQQTDSFNPAPYPIYTLRTADGGALTWFSVQEEYIALVPPGENIELFGDWVPLVGKKLVAQKLIIDSVDEYLVYIPAAKTGRPRAITMVENLTGGTAR